jgi:hypothetical protein
LGELLSIESIRLFLKHPDSIVFVGSGISTWSNLPNWSALLTELAGFLDEEGQSSKLVRREIRNGDLLQAASYGVSKLTPVSFGNFIRRALRFGTATPHAIHKGIVELGPSSFITTNYDTLIEQALGSWRSDTFFPAPVTNKHLIEIADIISARSSHFIFKPHGDVSDVSSIILTREQYRMLMPGGDRQNALEALKTLLVTRPVLYVGFGLRDPDFIFLRDLLLNIYQGAVRDHWAIMPDVDDEEANYWRDYYGIKLYGYKTHELADGRRDHRELLPLIEALAASDVAVAAMAIEDVGEVSEAERILALTRYTSGLIRRLTPHNAPVRVSISQTLARPGGYRTWGIYEGWTTTRFLIAGPEPAYLIGLPGSGKTFAVRIAALELAKQLQQACLEDASTGGDLTLPIVIDLKLYNGNLRAQIAGELPAGFTLNLLRGDLRLKLFLDAFNEMSSEHLESGALFKSLEELRGDIGEFSYAITSRTLDGLPERSGGLAVYEIARFDPRHVDKILADHGITLSGSFADDIRFLVRRPFFLHLVTKKMVEVPANARPRDLFASFVAKIEQAFLDRFHSGLPLMPIFSRLAYRAIETESEAFPLIWLEELVSEQFQNESFGSEDVINWLIAREFLIPYTGRRASFVHQSITEFCAATELARLSANNAISLREVLSSKKWDQCLFLALALMQPATADEVFTAAIEADLNLAINAVRYAEEDQSAAVMRLLKVLIARAKDDPQRLMHLYLRHLPVGREHVKLLRELVSVGDSIGAEAVFLLTEILGAQFKPELFDLLEEHADDYNFARNGIARALIEMVEPGDLPRLLSIAEFWLAKEESGHSHPAIGAVMANFEPQMLIQGAQAGTGTISPAMAKLLAGALSEGRSEASLAVLADLLLRYPQEVTSSFSLALQRNEDQFDTTHHLDHRHVEAIWSARSGAALWNSALSKVCSLRHDLKLHVQQMADFHVGFEAFALRCCAGNDKEALFSELEQLLDSDDAALKDEPFEVFPLSALDWANREDLLVGVLTRDLPSLRRSLLSNLHDVSDLARGSCALSALRPIIALAEVEPEDSHEEWVLFRLGAVVGHLGDADVRILP